MKNIELLKQRKGAMVKEARGVTELAETENRNLTSDEKTAVDKLLTDIRELDEDVTREERLQTLEMAKNPVAPHGEDRTSEKRAAFFSYLRHGKTGMNPEQRALVEDTNGLIMMPEDLDSEIYKATPQYSVIRQIANVRQTTRDKVARRSITDVNMAWGKLETGTLVTEATPVISKDYIYTEDLSGLVKIGRDELMDSDDILAQVITDAFAQKKAEVEAAAFMNGRGHAYGEPDGVTLDADIITSQTDLITADTIVPDDLINVEYALPAAYKAGASFMLHPTTEGVLRKVKATSNYLWNPNVIGSPAKVFDGYAMNNSSDMIVPAATNTGLSIVALFGNWKAGYTIVDRMGLSIIRLDELYAESGLIGFLAYFRVGGGVVRPDAFRALDNNT